MATEAEFDAVVAAGAQAAIANKQIADNPYYVGSWEWQAWLSGYHHAKGMTLAGL